MRAAKPRSASLYLDLENERFRQDKKLLKLTPKAFTVLRFLSEKPGRLVTKHDLLKTIWPEAIVTEGSLATCIREIRKALRDDPEAPRYIETVHRRGYRFIGEIVPTDPWEMAPLRGRLPRAKRQIVWPFRGKGAGALVGRETELRLLRHWMEQALDGKRQVALMHGEAGIGKTALLEAFLPTLNGSAVFSAYAQCMEHFGAAEAYLPWLEALGQLGREPARDLVLRLLSRYAPMWLAQMPWLASPEQRQRLRDETLGATRERMLREMAEALEALSAEKPLVVALEDLHWSDPSSVELLSYIARRPGPARLLIIATYRRSEISGNGHPLNGVRQELLIHRHCEELALDLLSENAVAAYMSTRFPGLPAEVARLVYRRTDGNPLYMTNVADYLLAKGLVLKRDGRWRVKGDLKELEVGAPATLREVIERQFDRQDPKDQQTLEAASVAGVEFSDAAVAAALEEDAEEVAKGCEGLARRGEFLRFKGEEEWPDGTPVRRYAFIHALYQDVLYQRVLPARRQRLHQRTGEREERAYGERSTEIAAELAVHFRRGQDYGRAVTYLRKAGENAIGRSAHVEAIKLLSTGLELLKRLPDSPERIEHELAFQIALGLPLTATKGYGAQEVERAYARARELCRQVGDSPQLFLALWGLGQFYFLRAQLQTTYEISEQLLAVAQRTGDTASLLGAHTGLGVTLFHLGKIVPARAHLEEAFALYRSQPRGSPNPLHVQDLGVGSLCWMALSLWHLGFPDRAQQKIAEALNLAGELAHPYSAAYAQFFSAWLEQLRNEPQAAKAQAEKVFPICADHGFTFLSAPATIIRGWALVGQGEGKRGVGQLRQGLAAWRATGAELECPYWLGLLASGYRRVGRTEEARKSITEALTQADETEERWCQAELYRLKGELLISRAEIEGTTTNRIGEAEKSLRQAIDIARRQRAKSPELRAATSLSRLWHKQGKKKQAHKLLAEIYGWFTQGFDTADLKEAKKLLDRLR